MPRFGTKAPPEGFDAIEPTIRDFEQQMREAEVESHEGKRIVESAWPVFRLHHQRTRFIWTEFREGRISKDLYEWCCLPASRGGPALADAQLVAMWKRRGYENLCCLRCVQPRDTNFGTTCICRVPRRDLSDDRKGECQHCGCHGCSG